MSILDTLSQITGAPPTYGEAEVSDRQDARWYDAGWDLLDALLGSLKRRFRMGEATPKERRGLLGRIVDTGRMALRSTTGLLTRGKITLRSWFAAMRSAAMPRLYAGALALLGPGDLPPVARVALKAEAVRQMSLLEKFRREIAAAVVRLKTMAGLPNGSVEVRAALYGSAAWSVAMNVHRAVMRAMGHSEERWVLGILDMATCAGCPRQAARGWVPMGTLPNIGSQRCNINCRCHLIYR